MGVVLRVTSGPHAGEEHLLDQPGLFVVGRSSQAGFSMQEDRLLSREHFVIEVDPSLCSLKDLGSTNGTKINGLRVETAPLRDGDVITAGHSAFVVQLDNSDQANHRPSTRCPGCGHALRGDEAAEVAASDQRLCASCLEKRRRHPRTHVDYLIEKRIGSGGMGEVYLARQLSTNRQVAIKMMVPTSAASEKAKDYFRREMMVLKDLLMPSGRCHPNIVAFYDIFEIDGQFQLVMEYVAGRNALDWVKELSSPLSIPTAARIGRLLLSALDYAHSKSYVHRDVKPSNLLVMGPPQGLQLKLSDFGLAKNFRENAGFVGLTHQGDIGGSVGFISPDHIRDFRDVKEPADIYGAAATIYFLLTMTYPFYGFNPHRGDAYAMILENPPVPLRAHRPDAPEGFERVLRKALEKHPRDRWKSAAEMSEALRPFLEGNNA
jgi:eukaryotic-like serine/threonine-protein kinase